MGTEVTESQPFKNLKELFDNVGNLKPWPEIKELRDSTDYVYSGLEISAERMQLEKLDREVQPRTLLCHDMKGGYLEDRFIYGSESYDSYLFYHWSVIDTFVYFSHHFITVPPFGWINVAHNHGVKVLGTVITEREGSWDVILESQEEVRRFADALILVAKFYKFDGWLLNVENTIKSEQVNNLIYFVKYLTENIHEAIRNSEIIWYDSVTTEGKLNWQNELNSKNIDFFLNCDGIYLNYNWTKSKLENSLALAKNHNRDIHDIYVGLDIWGRGCPGGGGFNSTYALQKIRHEGLSVAIFGPGWTHEFFGSKTFQEIEDLFWAQLFPYLYVHVPIYEEEVFKTSFCRGSGSLYYRCGQAIYKKDGKEFKYKPFYNLSLQNPQISVPIPHMKFTSSPQLPEPKSENDRNECSKKPIQYVYETRKNVIRVLKNVVNIENKMPMLYVNSFEFCSQFSFEGGGCIKLTTNDLTTRSYHRLFLVHIEFRQDIVAIIAYKEMESSIANGSQHEPILVLGNNTGLKSIVHYKSKDLFSNWKKCVYRTNMRTVNEIGISFARSNVCYLGEIILKQKPRHLNGYNSSSSTREASRSRQPPPPRWRVKERDRELLQAAVTVSARRWDAQATQENDIDEEAESLRKDMSAACDASMPRSVPGGGARNRYVYWWTDEIAETQRRCVRARRRLQRARRRRILDEEEICRCYEDYREKRRTLQREIKIAKARSWMELVELVESDPWGRPYQLVMKKLRPPAPPLIANMDPVLLANIIGTLFPRRQDDNDNNDARRTPSSRSSETTEWSEELQVTQEELFAARKRMVSRGDVAPGPDGIPSQVWAESMDTLAPRLQSLFTRCLREGIYPRAWRKARLVLLRKEGRPSDSPSAYRPVCLLDEVGKLFERIIAARLEAHMSKRVPGWHSSQYAFRQGRSTVDAVKRVRSMAEAMVSREGVALAVSLDVSNAFNAIPWDKVTEALEHFEVPPYLVRLIRSYLSDRWIIYTGRSGEEARPVERGVPQGSPLGPILWITAYDSVLRCPMPPGTGMVCYADDTLVLAGGRWWYKALRLAETAVACAVRAIRRLGLNVSPTKSEALGFFDHRRKGAPPPGMCVDIDGEEVPVRCQMRYLGLTIDSGWTFGSHFDLLVPRVTATANALCSLLPNIGGAGVRVRRLYEGVVRSQVLYGAPVWAEDLMANRRSLLLLRRLHRTTAVRIARGYRTISYASASVLAASPPFELQALALKRVYEHQMDLGSGGEGTQPTNIDQLVQDVREEAKRLTWESWRYQLMEEDAARPHRAVRAVLPNWEAWRDRGGVPLTFRMTQVLTGHGVFGEYLLRIRREVTSTCHHCEDEEEDTAQHTLEFCPAWEEPRRVLRLAIGESLAPDAVVKAMTRGQQELAAVRTYCERVMLAKEQAERSREKRGDPVRVARRSESTRHRRAAAPPPSPPF